jgi:cell division control protein 7
MVDDGTATDSDASADLRRGESDREDEDEEEEEVDDSVREDMKKLEDTFPGISDRFRLVNRIGEGTEIPSIFARSCPFLLGECIADR